MKKSTKFMMACGAMLLTAGTTFAQRNCNLELNITVPAANATIAHNDTAWLKFSIKNNGPDQILAGDTIFFDGGGGGQIFNVVAASNIANGASANFDPGVYVRNTVTADTETTICLRLRNQSEIVYVTPTDTIPASVTYNDSDTSNNTDCVTVMFKGPGGSSIFDLNKSKEELSLYPNPANSEVNFNLNLDKAENVVVTVKDIAGREVLRNDFGKVQAGNVAPFKLNVSNLNAGLYFVELNAGERKAVGKLNIRH